MNEIVKTERLSMRPFTEDDLEWMIGHRTDAEVARYLGGLELQTPSFVEKRLKLYIGCYRELGLSMCLTSLRDNGRPVGISGLKPLDKTGEIELGYSFDKDQWGKGLATEAALAWLDFGFRESGLERIVAVAEPENSASIRVMEKVGMKFEDKAFYYGFLLSRYAINKADFSGRLVLPNSQRLG
ncbi:MAG: N-acetyltransferase [Acidobacteria bacterium]|nr:MAG: N-acetyltransferase [Acidobacteriota bacterium]REJ98310.1 MAG: N-acetyltransferase [Acidobacteriota bacterium]REK17054.1 MAG: N-acetyltransferase [Acidobacteriota bacterium]REK42964.1 MAG: N-acetyltransferase [Acidobacteriota bacterium]